MRTFWQRLRYAWMRARVTASGNRTARDDQRFEERESLHEAGIFERPYGGI